MIKKYFMMLAKASELENQNKMLLSEAIELVRQKRVHLTSEQLQRINAMRQMYNTVQI